MAGAPPDHRLEPADPELGLPGSENGVLRRLLLRWTTTEHGEAIDLSRERAVATAAGSPP